jgi:hypothetical protein
VKLEVIISLEEICTKKLLKKRITRRVYFPKKFCNRDDIRKQMSGKKHSGSVCSKEAEEFAGTIFGA